MDVNESRQEYRDDRDDSDNRLGAAEQAERIAAEDEVVVPVLPLTAAGYAPVAGSASAGISGPAMVSPLPLMGGAFPAFAPDTSTDASDHRLAQAVEDTLSEDGRLSPRTLTALRIRVDEGGIVNLSGNVPGSDAEVEMAVAIASGVNGVRLVVWEGHSGSA